jgi:predicted polyphosphate/ATP-dependent NAD kinase
VRVGLVVNPVAGLGGRVGLKGSDGTEIQRRARSLGAVPRAGARAALALAEFRARLTVRPVVLTAAGPMGADAVREAGLEPEVVYEPGPVTTAADTAAAVRALAGVDLLLFAGGDGTARDVLDAVGEVGAVLGIPTGVKMHSAVFAVNPRAAGEVAASTAAGGVRLRDAEVMDLDEDAVRDGHVSARLYGHLPVPDVPVRIQQRKTGSSVIAPDSAAGIAAELADRVAPGELLVLGPGTTTRSAAAALGADVPVMGVNVLRRAAAAWRLVATDVSANRLLGLLDGAAGSAWVAVTPIGGQGFLLGRGNQQIAPEVLRAARLLVIATEAKLAALGGRPLLVDTGDDALDRELRGHISVITGYRRRTMYRLD